MARINDLEDFLTDVASAIKTKKGDETDIPASQFDAEILALPSQGIYQTKSVILRANGTTTVTPDENYDAIEQLDITVQVPDPIVFIYYPVTLNANGTINTYSSEISYSSIKSILASSTKSAFLEVTQETSTFYVRAIQDVDVNNGSIKFIGIYNKDGNKVLIEFNLYNDDTLTVNIILIESLWNKKTSIMNNLSDTYYPSTSAVYNEFQRKPVVVWESSTPSEYLKAIQANLSASPAWQLTNLDMTPFKRIKIYSCAGQKTGTTASASTTPAIILEMSLDTRNAISAYGGNYVGSIMVQKPNDANRFATLTCAVSADKTKFVVLRQTNLYGTAATSNNDVNADVFMIEGYYD